MSLSYLAINLITAIMFVTLVMAAAMILSSNPTTSREKATAFECGFDHSEAGRLPFSMRFFLLTIIFLIFDIEVALLFPLIAGLKLSKTFTTMASSVFLTILLAGLIHEWRLGSLSWVK